MTTRSQRAVLLQLARPGSPAARMRQWLTVAASTALGVTLVLLAALVELRDSVVWHSDGSSEPRAPGGLTPILAQPGLRVGTEAAVVLLGVPVLALLTQALYVDQVARERRHWALSLAGATPRALRAVSALETLTAFGSGGLLAGPVYLVLWVMLGRVPPHGSRLLPVPDGRLAVTWLGIVVLMALAGACAGVLLGRNRQGGVIGSRRSTNLRAHYCLGTLAGFAAPYLWFHLDRLDTSGDLWLAVVFVVEVVLVVMAAAAGVTAWTRHARTNPRRRDQAIEVLAAAQRRGNAGAAGRVAAVLFVCGIAFNIELTLLIEYLFDQERLADFNSNAGPTLVAASAVGAAAVIALGALALAATDHLLTAGRAVASTAALGMEAERLVRVQYRVLTATAVPAIIAGCVVPAVVSLAYGPILTFQLALVTAPLLGVAVNRCCDFTARLSTSRVLAAAGLEQLRTP